MLCVTTLLLNDLTNCVVDIYVFISKYGKNSENWTFIAVFNLNIYLLFTNCKVDLKNIT